MSKIPVVNAKTFEELLLSLALHLYAKKEVMFSIGTQMASTQLFRSTENKILPAPLVRQILREIELSPEEFVNLLNDL